MANMSEHKCQLPFKETSGLNPLPPNSSRGMRIRRKLRKLVLLDPDNFRCKAFYHHKSALLADQRKHSKGPYRYMIHPFSKLNSVIEISFFLVWSAKMIIEPLMNNVMKDFKVLHAVDVYGLCTIQMVLIVGFFCVGYIDKDSNEVILNPIMVAKNYLKSYFLFDFLSIISLEPPNWTLDHVSDPGHRFRLKFGLGYSDVLCLYVRLYSILDFVDNTGGVLGVPLRVRKCTRYLFKTFLYLHIFSCALYFVPQLVYYDNFPADSWLVEANIHPQVRPYAHKIYGECMLFVVCFFFGASAGKYRVSQTNEQVCLSVISLFGRLYTLFLLADVLRFFGIVGLSEASYEKQMLQLREYMVTNNIPTGLRARMVTYYEKKLQKRHFKEEEILGNLSDNLRADLFLFSARKLMERSVVFQHLPRNKISTLISMMEVETYAPGDVIFRPGQNVANIYFISFGSVAMFTRAGLELCHLEDGEVFGLCLSSRRTRTFFAVTCETTELFIIRTHVLEDFLKAFPRASQYFKHLALERLCHYGEIQEALESRMNNCRDELKNGALLEKKRERKLYKDEFSVF